LSSADHPAEAPRPRGWRVHHHRLSTRVYPPSRNTAWLTFLAGERIAVGNLPTAASIVRLPGEGITHVVNCRSRLQTVVSGDLAVERALFGRHRVAHAPMWDDGRPKPPALWASAARFAAEALDADPDARVLIHCQAGRRRSVMVAYAALRLRGHGPEDAERLIMDHRTEASLVPAYRESVERWLAEGGAGVAGDGAPVDPSPAP
jgi:protein-tyrosine phosphatase